MLRRIGMVLLVFACAWLTFGQSSTQPGVPSTASSPNEHQANIDSFEFVWKTVLEKHWDPKLGGLDWQSVHDELRPKVDVARNREETREVISAMLGRLKQTHFGVFPGDVYGQMTNSGDKSDSEPEVDDATSGLDVRVIDGRAVVTSVEAGSPAAQRGVKPGWEIVRVKGDPVAPALLKIKEQFASSTLLDFRLARAVGTRLQGPAGSTVPVQFLDGSDRTVTLEITRTEPRGKVVHFGNMPPGYFWSEWRRARPDVGYVRFNEFMDPEGLSKTFEQAVGGCRDCKGFVIDVRGNPGGIGGLAMGIAGWFIDQAGVHLGTEYLRGLTVKFTIFPRAEPFRGPLAILVDGCSASTAEIFAEGLKDLKRARIFGTHTAGAALPSVITRLPNGDGFQYAIANYISEGGQPLEGVGVTPDEEVHPTRRQLLAGQDPILDAALAWIHNQP